MKTQIMLCFSRELPVAVAGEVKGLGVVVVVVVAANGFADEVPKPPVLVGANGFGVVGVVPNPVPNIAKN